MKKEKTNKDLLKSLNKIIFGILKVCLWVFAIGLVHEWAKPKKKC